MDRDRDRLEDIVAAAADVLEFCRDLDAEQFHRDKVQRYAILHSLMIIGEAASRISEGFQEQHPEIPWRRIVGFRHRVVHGYGTVDLELAWEIASKFVVVLHAQVSQLLEKEK